MPENNKLPEERILEQEAGFADEHYATYEEDLDINPEFYRRYAAPRYMYNWREKAASLLGDVTGQTLLDYGCGMGEEAIYFARMGAVVTALDISPKGVEITLKRAMHNHLADSVTARVCDVTRTELPDDSFDCVHGLGILHHVGLDIGLSEVRRLLKPGGRAIFLEPLENSDAVRRFKRWLFRRLGKDMDVTEHETPLRLRDLKEQADRFSHFECYPYHLSLRLRRLLPTGRIHTLMKKADYCVLKAAPPLGHYAGGVVIYLVK